MPNTPAVSIIIPAYNVAPYIAETLDSVFAQTYRDFEVILINDGSTDETAEHIVPFRDRIVYLDQQNSGVMAARNAGLRVARGHYIALLDSDDLWLPRFLEVLVGMLEADSSLDVAYPNAWFFGSPNFDGKLHQDMMPVSEPITFDRVLRRECQIFGLLVFRRELIDRVGGYDESLQGQGAEDFELWLRMLKAGCRFKFTTEPLAKYRWRHNSLSNTGIGLLSCLISVYEKQLRGELTVSQREWIEAQLPELRAQLDYAQFKEELKQGRYDKAETHLAEANRFYRRPKLALMQAALKIAPQLLAKMTK
jgi:glycosyltransferase involved in cell wall biosynthesis